MARSTKTRLKSSRRSARPAATAPAPLQPASRPGGKLGLIVEHLSARTGATADELVEATGWQRHSVLGALSRLRSRGFALQLDVQAVPGEEPQLVRHDDGRAVGECDKTKTDAAMMAGDFFAH